MANSKFTAERINNFLTVQNVIKITYVSIVLLIVLHNIITVGFVRS